MAATPIVRLKNVSKDYNLGQTTVPALRNVNLELGAGDFAALCGPSGSGKTSLLNIIGCLDRPTSGEVCLMEQDISSLSDGALSELRNRRIGFIFQTFNLIPVLTAYENVEYPLLLGKEGRTDRRQRVQEVLAAVGLTEFASHRPDQLSGGQRQRVAIARALVTRPQLVLADEPTANLDSGTGKQILELMQRMHGEWGTTFLFSTHDPCVMEYAQRVFPLVDGQIASTGAGPAGGD